MDKEKITSEFITLAEAAEILSVGESTIRKLIRLGQLPKPIKMVSCTRLLRQDIAAYQAALIQQYRPQQVTQPAPNTV